ncbi:MAG: histidine phosphatase family protein [Actinobacteria bacterium]|nr:histidine phosphatase family protein [Actinomycetota bacterium]MCA1720586.1 histidine phosphatase family protein [Actinomycetota bacterium]
MVVRHGESSGNVARDKAEADELEVIDIAERDVDVPLSDLGERQARALGAWLADLPGDERPTVLWVSPYVRAQQTAQIALEAAGLDLPTVVDERLREREFGVLDRLTRRGIVAKFPDEAERRARLGKFYHRPPGGESWSDVLLRLRGAIDDLRRDTVGERVLLVAHQVVVLLCRYVVEQMSEEQVLEVDRLGDVANCSVTSYRLVGDEMVLERYNETAPVEEQDETVTSEPDVAAAPR